MARIVVHHLENSRSVRAVWLLEELGLPYEVTRYARNPRTLRAPKELRDVHPLGKAPVVTVDGDVLAESGAIAESLVARFGDGRLRPSEPAALDRYRYCLHYAEGSLMPPLLVRLVVDRLRAARLPFFVKPIARGIANKIDETFTEPELRTHFAFVEQALAEHEYFAGDEFSAADIQMSYPIEASIARGGMTRAAR